MSVATKRREGWDQQGWGWPHMADQAHYFPRWSALSLCGKFILLWGQLCDGAEASADHCVECQYLRDLREEQP